MKYVKNGLLFISLCLIISDTCSAQSHPNEPAGRAFKVVKATVQHWAGGVAGRSGVTYYIQLETSSHAMVPDTVWINGYVYPIDSFRSNGQYAKAVDSLTKQIRYSILVSETHDRFNRGHPIQQQDTAIGKTRHTRNTPAGTALISYRYKKKQHFFTVKSFTELKQLNYP